MQTCTACDCLEQRVPGAEFAYKEPCFASKLINSALCDTTVLPGRNFHTRSPVLLLEGGWCVAQAGLYYPGRHHHPEVTPQ